MKLNLAKIARTVVRAAKKNPEVVLAVAGLIAPGLVRKAAPIIVAATVKR